MCFLYWRQKGYFVTYKFSFFVPCIYTAHTQVHTFSCWRRQGKTSTDSVKMEGANDKVSDINSCLQQCLRDTLYIKEIPFTLWQAKNFAYKSSVIPLSSMVLMTEKERFFALSLLYSVEWHFVGRAHTHEPEKTITACELCASVYLVEWNKYYYWCPPLICQAKNNRYAFWFKPNGMMARVGIMHVVDGGW